MCNEVSSLSFVMLQLTFIILKKKKNNNNVSYGDEYFSHRNLLSSVKLLHGILVKSPKPKKVSYWNDLTAVQS